MSKGDDLLRTPTEGQDMTKVLFPGAPAQSQGSPRLSFKGWLLSVWLTKNKAYVKKVLAPVSAIATAGAIDAALLKYVGIAIGLGLLTIVFKMGWDAFDYFVSEQGSPQEVSK